MQRNQVDDRFLIMENVGTSLEQIFAQRDNPRSITLIASVVRALHSLHSVGVVNGNVEERTVFVRADGRVVLTDFGLASQIGASSTSTRKDDLIAAAELLDDAIPLMKEGLGSRYPRIDDPPTLILAETEWVTYFLLIVSGVKNDLVIFWGVSSHCICCHGPLGHVYRYSRESSKVHSTIGIMNYSLAVRAIIFPCVDR